MGSGNWIVDNLNSALGTWNGKLAEIWTLLSTGPEEFKGGGVWTVIVGINDGLKAIGYALLVIFFVMGVVKTCGSFTELRKPEQVLKCFVRFALAQAAVSHGMELMTALFTMGQGMVNTIMGASGMTGLSASELPDEMVTIIEDVSFLDSIPLWAVTLLGSLFIWVLSLVMILTVYSRFLKLYMATAIAPLPLALQQHRHSLSEKLRRHLPGGLCHRFGLCDFLRLRIRASGAVGPQPRGGDHRVELCGRNFIQHAGTGGRYQNERPADPGADGPRLKQALGADGGAAIQSGLTDPPGKGSGGRQLASQILQQLPKAPGQGDQPGQGHKAHHGKQDTVRQGGMDLIPAVKQGEHQNAVEQRNAQPEFQGQTKQKRQQSGPNPQYHKRHIASPPLLVCGMLP